ncbi:MAG: class I SAM-dependent methyltransferase [Candidatus Helarchaeota archaeon]
MNSKKLNSEHYFTKHPSSKLKLYKITGTFLSKSFNFFTSTGVFSYKKVDKGTSLLLNSIILPKNKKIKILDLGCGYGIIGIVLASLLPESHITMIDINSRAIWLSKKNITINNLKNIEVKYGDFLQVINNNFDLILTNPPISLGKSILFKLFRKSYEVLNNGGTLQLVIKTKQGAKSTYNELKQIFGENNVKLLKIKSGYRVYQAHKI